MTPDGQLSVDEEWNVNGSYMNIEGITSPDGRILGKMAHSERRGDGVAINIYGEQDIKIFESGVDILSKIGENFPDGRFPEEGQKALSLLWTPPLRFLF